MGKKLTIFLIDGTEVGPRTVEIGNWSGKAIYSPRTSIPKIISRSEFDKPGVYILKSEPNESIYSERIYIGEAEKLGNRLKQHLVSKEFTEFVAFISKDEMLTKGHIKFLESRLVSLAREAKNSEIENGNQPELPSLPEADISDMEHFLEQIKLILPVMNFKFLIPSTVKSSNSVGNSSQTLEGNVVFTLKSKKITAKLIETEQGYVVLAGSECSKTTSQSISEGWLKLRKKLVESNVLEDQGNIYVFREDTVFSSISAAAAVILGRQAAGPVEWIDAQGKTYKDYQENKYGN